MVKSDCGDEKQQNDRLRWHFRQELPVFCDDSVISWCLPKIITLKWQKSNGRYTKTLPFFFFRIQKWVQRLRRGVRRGRQPAAAARPSLTLKWRFLKRRDCTSRWWPPLTPSPQILWREGTQHRMEPQESGCQHSFRRARVLTVKRRAPRSWTGGSWGGGSSPGRWPRSRRRRPSCSSGWAGSTCPGSRWRWFRTRTQTGSSPTVENEKMPEWLDHSHSLWFRWKDIYIILNETVGRCSYFKTSFPGPALTSCPKHKAVIS